MTDIFTPEKRSEVMSRVRDRHTKPELILRSALHRLGFRYKLKNNNLPGKPDLVFPKFSTVIFVHGCFWHCHKNCKKASIPKSNTEFWEEKLGKNVARDKRNYQLLKKLGWKVIVVWECELYKDTLITVEKVVDILLQSDKMLDGRSDLPGVLKRDILLKSAAKKVMRRLNKVCKVEK